MKKFVVYKFVLMRVIVQTTRIILFARVREPLAVSFLIRRISPAATFNSFLVFSAIQFNNVPCPMCIGELRFRFSAITLAFVTFTRFTFFYFLRAKLCATSDVQLRDCAH